MLLILCRCGLMMCSWVENSSLKFLVLLNPRLGGSSPRSALVVLRFHVLDSWPEPAGLIKYSYLSYNWAPWDLGLFLASLSGCWPITRAGQGHLAWAFTLIKGFRCRFLMVWQYLQIQSWKALAGGDEYIHCTTLNTTVFITQFWHFFFFLGA